MTSFASAAISKSGSLFKTELPDDEMSALEFPGGIAYDHEALPKLVAVHSLIEVNPGQTNAQDVSVTDKDVKKTRLPKLSLRKNTIPRHGSRRWIIRPKPELPFSQLTTAPKTPEEISQAQSLPSASCHDKASLQKTLFDLCDNACTAYCNEDLDKRSQGEVNENKLQGPPSQELPSYTSKDTSSKVVISRNLDENEIEIEAATAQTDRKQSNENVKGKEAHKPSEIMETSKSFKWHNSNPLGDSQEGLLHSKQGHSVPVAELKATRSDADRGLSVKSLEHSVQTVAFVREDENNDQEVMGLSHDTPFVPTQDSIMRSTVKKEHIDKLSETGVIQSCSHPKFTSNKSKITIRKASKSAIVRKDSLKKLKEQVRAVSQKNLAPSSINLKQEKSASKKTIVQKVVTKPDKTLLSTNTKLSRRKPPANQGISRSSATDKTPFVKNSDASRNGKLSLRERVLKRIKRIKDNMKPYKETPGATDLYSKLAKYRKLGLGVALSLSELSKNGEINQEVPEDGQVKKNEPSEELLEEVVLIETSRNDSNTHETIFTTELKKRHFKLKEKIKSKNRMKEHEELKIELNNSEVSGRKECSLAPSESFVHADEDDGHDIHTIGSTPIQENERQEEPEIRDTDDLSVKKSLKEEHGNGNWSDRVNDLQTSIPEKNKSLNQCLDKLKTITAIQLKRPLLGNEKENGLRANNQESGCIVKRPRKVAPRRLAKGRCPSHSDDDSISPDNSLNDLPQGIDVTSSEVQDHLSFSNLPLSDAQGRKSEETDEPFCDFGISTGKSGSIAKEENLDMENMNDDSSVEISEHRDTIALPKHSASESATVTCNNTTSLQTFHPPCLFTKDTLNEQMEKADWEPSWYGDEDKTPVYTHSWLGVPYITIPQGNYTIKTSLDREERIKALLAKQNQLLSKINNNLSGHSS